MCSHTRPSATLRTVACQAPQSMGFSRQEHWSGLPFPTPGDLPDSGITPMSLPSPTLASRVFYHWNHLGSPLTWSQIAQPCLTLCDLMDCSLPGSSVHGIFQARVLEWVAISFSRRSSWPRDWTQVSCTVGRCFTVWATREVVYIEQIVLTGGVLRFVCFFFFFLVANYKNQLY